MFERVRLSILRLAAVGALAALAWLAGPAMSVRSQGAGGAEQARFDAERLKRIDALVERAVSDGQAPGAVVAVGDRGGVVYERAFGSRALEPAREAMSLDTIFDAASLTKVLATTPAVMLLVEEGRIRLADRVSQFLPECGRYGKDGITVRHLLTHTSGLRPDLDLGEDWRGYDEAIRRACEEVPIAPLDARFVYSDINFLLLGEIVRRVSGEPLDRFARGRIFEPLGMRDSMFQPPAALQDRIAPTTWCTPFGWPCEGSDLQMLRGVVHDPTARRTAGVAGHAGVFTTAADLARFARFLLNGGALDGVRVLAPLSVARMTSPATPPDLPEVRGLGWDIDSALSLNRGDLMAPGSFGHTGFTGTSIWIDPSSDLFVVFLSSRVHPRGRGDVTALRAQVATLAAAALRDAPASRAAAFGGWRLPAPGPSRPPVPPAPAVLTGIDVLRSEQFASLRGRRVGLLTNQTGRARDGVSTVELLRSATGVSLVSLFSPEHGIGGTLDTQVPSTVDPATGIPVHSLYGETRRPTDAMLADIDTIVVDLQDVGVRFYTYASTMAYVLEAAAPRGLDVVVLDRPNPINGWQIEGPMLDADGVGFTGYLSMPVRHGLTLGELARLFNEENHLGARLQVVAMRGWSRADWFDRTGQPWIGPSPNLRNLLQATLYPGIGAIEWANISVGRGTDAPFEQIGAPWIDGVALAAALNARGLPGVSFYPVSFTPAASRYAGERCGGVFIVITDREALRPVRLGVEIAAALQRQHPAEFDLAKTATLLGSRADVERLRAGADPAGLAASWADGEARWRRVRSRYLLYQ
jgi:uncharacterized protein YbbC (DUF1343 family)/CubicO group peptidase (beta-lactamase class C family)